MMMTNNNNRNSNRGFLEKPEAKRTRGTSRRSREDILKYIFEKWYWGARTGLIWLRIGTSGGLL